MKKLLIFLLFISPFALKAQNNMSFDFDYARFGYDSLSNYVEFYYSFGLSNLTVVKKDMGFAANALLHIQIADTAGQKVLLDKEWKVDNPLTDTTMLTMNKNLVGVVGFVVPKGVYKCTVSGIDGNNKNKSKTIVETITVDPFIGKNLCLSDVELSTGIRQDGADPKSIFYKNTLEVQPNPTMLYGEGSPVLFYYSEVYNMMKNPSTDNLEVKTFLFNSKGYKIFEKSKSITRIAGSRVEVGTLNLNKYPTDTYTIVVSAVDSSSNTGTTSSKRFYVYNPSVADTFKSAGANMDLLSSEYSVLSAEECDQMFESAKYIASSNETSQYHQLQNVEAKRDFLFKFWRKRDDDPSTAVNEYKKRYMDRVKLCNERYGTINKQGMKTDRGRVYIVYGEPDEIERYPNDIDKKPYEVWHYNSIEGGVVFIFGDISGFNDYQLLHSTKRGELRDDNWMMRIQSASY